MSQMQNNQKDLITLYQLESDQHCIFEADNNINIWFAFYNKILIMLHKSNNNMPANIHADK